MAHLSATQRQCCHASTSRRVTPVALRRQGRLRICCQAAVAAPPAPQAVAEVKTQLLSELQGLNRGIFGLPGAKKQQILDLIQQLESHTPVSAPVQDLGMCHGRWRLLFSTITITGVKRTKLGLREFIKLGDFTQIIDTDRKEAVNVVDFNVVGLSFVGGALTITASFAPASGQRVDIKFREATLVPTQLQKLFEANYDLLLSIFNPEGYLDITYIDATHRVGRDDKGHVFLLERAQDAASS